MTKLLKTNLAQCKQTARKITPREERRREKNNDPKRQNTWRENESLYYKEQQQHYVGLKWPLLLLLRDVSPRNWSGAGPRAQHSIQQVQWETRLLLYVYNTYMYIHTYVCVCVHI